MSLSSKFRFILLLATAGIFGYSFFAFVPNANTQNEVATDTTIIRLNAVAGLQFDLARFTVKPGAAVKLILRNTDDMSHNIVFTKPGKRESIVNAAMKLNEKGPSMNYTPDSRDVLWSLPVLSPGEERVLRFIAPESEAVYPYVCTFPGHGFYMYGAMYVRRDEKMPALGQDENIPPTRRIGKALDHAPLSHQQQRVHPYELTPPYLYRVYMPDASPAAFAVRLSHNLSFCWDAETCELRYAWEGEFVDNTAFWKGKPNGEAKILGRIFYRNSIEHPLRIGKDESVAVVSFQGYQLRDRYPEFHYTLDGIDVYETVYATASGEGLIRSFRIPDVVEDVWFKVDANDGMTYECSVGKWKSSTLQIPKSAVNNFSIVMTKKEDKPK